MEQLELNPRFIKKWSFDFVKSVLYNGTIFRSFIFMDDFAGKYHF